MTLSPNRPSPVPDSPWIMTQTWLDLLFLHYPVSPHELVPLLPQGLEPDLYDGMAWVSIVPFEMSNIRLLRLPSVPGVSTFNELNIRTYVTLDQKPGAYFFSLDAHSWPTVLAGRSLFHLAYHHANMSLRQEQHTFHFNSTRTDNPDLKFSCSYTPNLEQFFMPPAESLEYFLTERYYLYSEHAGKLYRGDIDHHPWKLHPVRYDVHHNTMLQPFGLSLPQPALAHYSRRVDTRSWFIHRIR